MAGASTSVSAAHGTPSTVGNRLRDRDIEEGHAAGALLATAATRTPASILGVSLAVGVNFEELWPMPAAVRTAE
jgi:hypothetical protein